MRLKPLFILLLLGIMDANRATAAHLAFQAGIRFMAVIGANQMQSAMDTENISVMETEFAQVDRNRDDAVNALVDEVEASFGYHPVDG